MNTRSRYIHTACRCRSIRLGLESKYGHGHIPFYKASHYLHALHVTPMWIRLAKYFVFTTFGSCTLPCSSAVSSLERSIKRPNPSSSHSLIFTQPSLWGSNLANKLNPSFKLSKPQGALCCTNNETVSPALLCPVKHTCPKTNWYPHGGSDFQR